MKIRSLSPGQVYVVVRTAKNWEEYPLPPELVARSTILAVFRPENTSEYALVFYNFSQSTGLVPVKDIHIFDGEERRIGQGGLTPAFEP